MDAFEAVVGEMLHRDGYWVQSPYRVGLTKAEKVEIGRPSCPRWELDIVAYKANRNPDPHGGVQELSGSLRSEIQRL